jgi:peptide/nickel transport system substrate-binding protein
VAAAVATLALLAACSGHTVDAGGTASPSAVSATPSPAATNKPGGTLRIVGESMPSGDPGWADDAASRLLTRMVARQLYSYPADSDPTVATVPVPDLAAGPPVVSDGGRTYTVSLNPAARWDVPGGSRRVTATDVARGIKRLCTPPDPSSMRGYFAATVVGFAAYCARLAAQPPAGAAAFVEEHAIAGVDVVGDGKLVFHLTAPAADFIDVLALPAASPVPFEAIGYAPDSADYLAHLISDGPYHFTGPPTGDLYRLTRNQAWNAGSDQVRSAFADHVTIQVGMSADAVQQALQRDQADLELDTSVPVGDIAAATRDPLGRLTLDGPTTLTTLVVGLHGPATAGLRLAAVREALPYCVDRSTVVAALGGAAVAQPTAQLLAPPMTGYTPRDPYPSFGDAGDPARCRSLLAGAPGGASRKLTLLAPATPAGTAIASALVTAFARGGVTLVVTTVPTADYARAAVSPTKQGWDLALATVTPEWFGNAGRTVFQPLLDGFWAGPRPADGGYRLRAVSAAFAAAAAETNATRAATMWGNLDAALIRDVAVVPLALTVTPRFHGSNVRGFVVVDGLGNADPTNVSLGTT